MTVRAIGAKRNSFIVGIRAVYLGFGHGNAESPRGIAGFLPGEVTTFFFAVDEDVTPDSYVLCVLGEEELIFPGAEFLEYVNRNDPVRHGRYIPNWFHHRPSDRFFARLADQDELHDISYARGRWFLLSAFRD